ncbi:hypothetical protein [Sphingobium ummariense]
MRRKGERPVPRELDRWAPDHPVADMIRTGTCWFDAWLIQKCTADITLSKLTGMDRRRIEAIRRGGYISRAELDALAIAWSVSAGDLIRSMPTPNLVVE